MLTAQQVLDTLKLQPLPAEGGFFLETYRSPQVIARSALPAGYSGDRSTSTAIYYFLTPDTFSAMHQLPGDEVFHFYLGDPVEMLQLRPDGSGEIVVIGQAILGGMRPQVVVPGAVWQGSRLVSGGRFALMGTTMAPGFEFSDYKGGRRKELVAKYPQFAELIAALTASS
jgi:uncharacterized protein